MEGIFKTLEKEGQLGFIKPWLIVNENYDELYEKNYFAAKEQLEAVLERFWQNEWLSHGFPFALQGHLLHNYFAYLISYEICKLYICSTYESDKTWDKILL